MESPVVETREHQTTEQCWCQPVLDYVDPQTGNQVWVHNEAPNEPACQDSALLSERP